VLYQHVGQQQRERLATDEFAGAPNGMPEPERFLLAGEAGGSRVRQFPPQSIERFLLLPLEQRHFQFELPVEMILDDPLIAPGDEYEMLNASLARLVYDVLDQRPVDHRQHFLRHRLCCRQEPGPKPGHGKNCFANDFHGRQELRDVQRFVAKFCGQMKVRTGRGSKLPGGALPFNERRRRHAPQSLAGCEDAGRFKASVTAWGPFGVSRSDRGSLMKSASCSFPSHFYALPVSA